MEFIKWIRKEFDLTILLIEHQMHLVMNICERLLSLISVRRLPRDCRAIFRRTHAFWKSISER